jgi:hypothetical protein
VLSVEREMVYTLVRLCCIELEAGHTEHCIALFQARARPLDRTRFGACCSLRVLHFDHIT